MNVFYNEFRDFIKYESKFGLRVLAIDLIMINKLYFRDYFVNKVLDYAKKQRHKYTFFVRSKDLNKKRKIISKLTLEGHEIASHGSMHVLYDFKSKRWLKKEIKRSKNAFLKFKIKPKGFRSPFLSENNELYEVLDELGFDYVSNRYQTQKDVKGDFKLYQDKLSYPSDWQGLVVDKLKIKNIINRWSSNKGTILLHPWIFLKHLKHLEPLLIGKKDFRIISNLEEDRIKISFDLY